jgi:hypothetical protein
VGKIRGIVGVKRGPTHAVRLNARCGVEVAVGARREFVGFEGVGVAEQGQSFGTLIFANFRKRRQATRACFA